MNFQTRKRHASNRGPFIVNSSAISLSSSPVPTETNHSFQVVPNPQVLYNQAAVAISEEVFLCVGGVGSSPTHHLKTVIAYNIEDDEWTYRSELPYTMYGATCIRVPFRQRDSVLCFFNSG